MLLFLLYYHVSNSLQRGFSFQYSLDLKYQLEVFLAILNIDILTTIHIHYHSLNIFYLYSLKAPFKFTYLIKEVAKAYP